MSLLGILINRAGARLVTVLHLPLYLDCIGTVLTAALGGPLPGMLTGYVTNLIGGITHLTTMYYATISVMIAAAAAWFGRRGWLEKPARLPLCALVLALVGGGGVGSILSFCLFGFNFGDGASAELAHRFYDAGFPGVFLSQLAADFLVNLLDKAIIVVIAYVVLRLLPPKVKASLWYHGWVQAPL